MGKWLRAIGLEKLSEEPLGDYSSDVTPPARSSVTVVTEDRALALPALFRGVQIIAGMGSQLRLEGWRGGVLMNPQPSLILQPDPWRSLRSFLLRAIICLVLNGNAFLLKQRDPAGNVIGLEVLNPRHVWIKWDKGVKSYDVLIRGVRSNKAYSEIEHVKALEIYGHDRGIGPITACRLAVAGILNVREYADKWFADGEGVAGLLNTDQKLTPEEINFYKNVWYGKNPDGTDLAETHPDYGRTGPRVRVTGAGLTFDPMILNPADAQWLESQAFGVLDIARMLGIPGDYLMAAVEGASLTYANLSMIDTQFLKTNLFPNYLAPLEEAISSVIPRGQTAKFNTEAFLRPDDKAQADIDQIYLQANVISAQEIRDRKGWAGPPPKPVAQPQKQETPA